MKCEFLPVLSADWHRNEFKPIGDCPSALLSRISKEWIEGVEGYLTDRIMLLFLDINPSCIPYNEGRWSGGRPYTLWRWEREVLRWRDAI